MINDFTKGINYFIQGFYCIFSRGLRKYIIMPLLINILVYSALIWLGSYYFSHLNDFFYSFLPNWLKWLTNILWVIFIISVILISLFTFSILANVFAAPFNGFLSARLQKRYLHHPSTENQPVWKTSLKLLQRQLQFLAFYLPRVIFMLILFFIPIIHIIYPFLHPIELAAKSLAARF